MLKYFDPLLPQWLHQRVKQQVLDPMIEWHFPGNGVDVNNSCFMRKAFDKEIEFSDWSNIESLTYALRYWIDHNSSWFSFKGLNRCILNFYAPGQSIGWHTDNDRDNLYTLIYYVNDSDGGTETKDQVIPHKENAGILIPSNQIHCPTVSLAPRRISIAWILEGNINV